MRFILLNSLFIVILFSFDSICKADECSKVYLLPFFAQNSICGLLGCAKWISTFVDGCSDSVKNRQLISVFNFGYQFVYTCLVNKFLDTCDSAYNKHNTVTLKKEQHYKIWAQLEKQFKKDQQSKCFNGSLAIFMTDIYDFQDYPDLDDLFNLNLTQTLERLFDLKLHSFFLLTYSYDDPTVNQTNAALRNLKFNETNFLEFRAEEYGYHVESKDDPKDMLTCGVEFQVDTGPRRNQRFPTLELAIGIPSGVILFLILIWIFFWTQRVWRRWQESKIEEFAFQHSKNARQILFGNYQDEFEVTPKELKVNQMVVLGYGFSGKVFLGHLKKKRNNETIEIDVAVKFPHAFNNQAMRMDMIKEIGFMKTLGKHPNLLIMVGYVKSIQEPAIATELCVYGDLLGLLKKHNLHFMSSQKCQKVKVCFLLPDLIRIALQICNGLIHLVNLKYVHRDIAARNVLLSKDLTAKVGDFGLCRLAEEYIYQDKGARIPIKNSPYEALKYGRFSEKSDVWSFGVLMWELFSGGKKPFDDVHVMSFVNHLDDENKLIFPEETPKQLSEIIANKCFQKDPNKRATFVELKSDLYGFYSIVCSVLKEQEKINGNEEVKSIGSLKSNCGSIRHRV